jgi:hypothetical protein
MLNLCVLFGILLCTRFEGNLSLSTLGIGPNWTKPLRNIKLRQPRKALHFYAHVSIKNRQGGSEMNLDSGKINIPHKEESNRGKRHIVDANSHPATRAFACAPRAPLRVRYRTATTNQNTSLDWASAQLPLMLIKLK